MNRSLPAPASDIALVVTRVILAVVMFAHGYQKMFIQGIGRTTDGFQAMNIPLAIVSASFVTVVEVAGSVLLVAGALTTVVCALMLFEMIGAAVFVHASHGIFIQDGGFELVAVISAVLIALAATGPGRFSVDRWIHGRQKHYQREFALARTATVPAPAPLPVPFQSVAPVPPMQVGEPITTALPVRTPRAAHASR